MRREEPRGAKMLALVAAIGSIDTLRQYMRSASLGPYKSSTSPNRPWCVDVPPTLSDTGKRKRKFAEAAEAYKLLEGTSATLLDAVHGFLAVQKARQRQRQLPRSLEPISRSKEGPQRAVPTRATDYSRPLPSVSR
jgi:hypothetical protein